MRKTVVLIALLCASICGQSLPGTMTRLTAKLESPEIPKDSFAAQPKRMYRAGNKFCRIEENADLAHGIHGLMIISEPDVWMVNQLDKTARHMVDTGPTFNCRMPIFATAGDVKSSDDLKQLVQLEFGRELNYFRSRSGPPSPGPVLRGKSTKVYSVENGDVQLFLFTDGDPEAPVSVVKTRDKSREIIWYGEYMEVPFDAKMLARPEGVKIDEVEP